MPVCSPILPVIRCVMTMAITLNRTAHTRAKPKLQPVRPLVVTVPGPISAALTIAAGPIFFSRCHRVFFGGADLFSVLSS